MINLKKQNFNELCKVIIETDGNPTTEQIKKCGYTFEHFLKIANCDRKKLVEKAKEMYGKY